MSAEMDDANPPRPAVRPRTRRRRRARFEVGRVLGLGISVWFGGLPVYLSLTAVVFAPYAVLRWWSEIANPSIARSPLYTPGMQLLEQLLSMILAATVIYAVFQKLRGRRVGMGDSIVYGLGRLPAVLGVSVLVGLAFFAIWLPVFVMAMLDLGPLAALATLPTFVFFMIAYCGLWVAVPACVVERPGLIESLRRSWKLTKGSKGMIFVLLILFGLFGFLIGLILTLAVSALPGSESAWANLLLTLALSIAVLSLSAVVTAVGYHELRRSVDGIDAEELAAIFD